MLDNRGQHLELVGNLALSEQVEPLATAQAAPAAPAAPAAKKPDEEHIGLTGQGRVHFTVFKENRLLARIHILEPTTPSCGQIIVLKDPCAPLSEHSETINLPPIAIIPITLPDYTGTEGVLDAGRARHFILPPFFCYFQFLLFPFSVISFFC